MRVLLLDNWTDAAKAELAKVCEVYNLVGAHIPTKDVVDLLPRLTFDGCVRADGLVSSLDVHLDAKRLAAFVGLRFIASGTTGLDHIDLDYCKAHNIAVLSLQGETSFLRDVHATAEHTVALMLSLLRKIPFAHRDVCEGRWDREAWQGSELHGKTVGIIGHGRVGRQVDLLLRAFDTRIIWQNDGMTCWPHDIDYAEVVMRHDGNDLHAALSQADIVSLHVPLNDSTRGMIGAAQFAMMKPTAVLINTSRGAVVDEDALLWALREGTIAGAALDVMCGEPLIKAKLREYARCHDNLILTPHLGGNTAESRLKTQLFMVSKIRDFIGGVSDAGTDS